MPGFISDSPLARGLVRIGDEAIAREDNAKLRDYFADDYVFHGPGGDLGFEELRAYFASLRAAFSNLRLVREQIIAEGRFLAARNTFSGDFTDEWQEDTEWALHPGLGYEHHGPRSRRLVNVRGRHTRRESPGVRAAEGRRAH